MTRTARQLAGGLIYAGLSLLLVVGSLSLALVQKRAAAPQPTSGSPTATRERVTPTLRSTVMPSATSADRTASPTPPSTTSPSATAVRTTTATPAIALSFPTVDPLLGPPAYWSRGCGPYPGWVKGYVVRYGDTLYRIALTHGTTVSAMERANCLVGPTIYYGQRLWVPFILAYPPP